MSVETFIPSDNKEGNVPDFHSFHNMLMFRPTSFTCVSHTHNALFVLLTNPSYSPSPCLGGTLFNSTRNANHQIFSVPAAVIVYIHLHKTLFAPSLFTKPEMWR